MWLVIRRRTLLWRGVCVWLLLGLTLTALAYFRSPPVAEASGLSRPETVYVIDPGHGGEDGGAVAADGTVESGVNLAIALRLRDILRFCGQDCVMTREEDVSIYSPGCETLRQKKASDLKNRVALVNAQEGAILVSVHQNCLPSAPSVHGAQAFYNGIEGADALASAVQEALNRAANPEKGKTPVRISDSIYLTKNVTAPAVLIECGFLSNPQETERLKTAEYQRTLAATMAAGLLQAAGEGVP